MTTQEGIKQIKDNMQLIDECLTYFGFKVFESSKNKVCMEKNGD